MSAAASLSLDEYLSTQYEPECELIGGQPVPRVLGTIEHSDAQFGAILALSRYAKESVLKVGLSLSFKHGDEVLIPDACVYRRGARLYRGILDEPPVLCVEVLSPSERPSELFAKCETYHAWGVPYCWVIDPIQPAAWQHHSTAPLHLVRDTLRAGEIEVALAEIFGLQEHPTS